MREKEKFRLDDVHINFLTLQSTLVEWSGKTLAVRCALFHRKFLSKHIKPWRLAKIYSDHRIHRKRIVTKEVSARTTPLRTHETVEFVRERLNAAIAQGRKVIFADEVLFTRSSALLVDYSRQHQNITINLKGSHGGYMAATAGISHDVGLEFVLLQHDAVKRDDFIEYLTELKDRQGNQKIAFFLDNLAVHHTTEVKEAAEEMDIMLVFNKAYSPDFNPIETIFSVVKGSYKRAKHVYEVRQQNYD